MNSGQRAVGSEYEARSGEWGVGSGQRIRSGEGQRSVSTKAAFPKHYCRSSPRVPRGSAIQASFKNRLQPRMVGVDARRAMPPDLRPPHWGLAGNCQLDPSHPAFVNCGINDFEPCRDSIGVARENGQWIDFRGVGRCSSTPRVTAALSGHLLLNRSTR